MYGSHSKTMKAMKGKRTATKEARNARMAAGTNVPVVKPPYPPR
jgi:hypothetical protein